MDLVGIRKHPYEPLKLYLKYPLANFSHLVCHV